MRGRACRVTGVALVDAGVLSVYGVVVGTAPHGLPVGSGVQRVSIRSSCC